MVIEIKTRKITHQDLGQLQMYVNYYDQREKLPDENPTVGILLCASKNNEMVKMALPEDNKSILAGQYKLILPTEKQLLAEWVFLYVPSMQHITIAFFSGIIRYPRIKMV